MSTLAALRRISDVPVILADHDGFITYINQQFEQVFGWTSSAIVGQPLSVIIPANLRDAHHLGFSRFLETGQTHILHQPLALKAVTKDGRVFDAEHTIIAEQHNQQWAFGATIRPL